MAGKHSRAVRDQAIALAAEHGATAASERMGIPLNTVRSWVRRHGSPTDLSKSETPRKRGAKVDELERWEQRLEQALDESERLTRVGDHENARRQTIQAGIATEKVLLLRREQRAAATLDPALSEAQGELVVRVLRGVLLDLGLSQDERARESVRSRLAQVGAEPAVRSRAELEQSVLRLQDEARERRREALHVRLLEDGISLRDRDVVDFWLAFLGVQGDPAQRWGPELYSRPRFVPEPPRRAPVPRPVGTIVPVANAPASPFGEVEDDDEPVEAELVDEDDEMPVPLLPRPRALPRAGASQFPRGSVQARIAGWGGSDG